LFKIIILTKIFSNHGEQENTWSTNVVRQAQQKKFFVMQAYKLLKTNELVKKPD